MVESALLGSDYTQSGPVTLNIVNGVIDSISEAVNPPRLLATPAKIRSALPSKQPLITSWSAIEASIGRHYRGCW